MTTRHLLACVLAALVIAFGVGAGQHAAQALSTDPPPRPIPTDDTTDDDTTDDDQRKPRPDTRDERRYEFTSDDVEGYRRARILIENGDYGAAIDALKALGRPDDADVLNLLGYSHRKLGLVDVGIGYYLKALARNPEHRGVHEYLGEAYLQKDELGKARVLLDKLEVLCGGTGCEEYEELHEAVVAYEARGRS